MRQSWATRNLVYVYLRIASLCLNPRTNQSQADRGLQVLLAEFAPDMLLGALGVSTA